MLTPRVPSLCPCCTGISLMLCAPYPGTSKRRSPMPGKTVWNVWLVLAAIYSCSLLTSCGFCGKKSRAKIVPLRMYRIIKIPPDSLSSLHKIIFHRTLFLDCVVQSGSNPSVILIKELIESEQITGVKATWVLAAVSHYVKTPTSDLLQELLVFFLFSILKYSSLIEI